MSSKNHKLESASIQPKVELLDVVALLEDVPDQGLVRGQVGTVVERWSQGVYEVEFSGHDGQTYAMTALREDQLMKLFHEPSQSAAA